MAYAQRSNTVSTINTTSTHQLRPAASGASTPRSTTPGSSTALLPRSGSASLVPTYMESTSYNQRLSSGSDNCLLDNQYFVRHLHSSSTPSRSSPVFPPTQNDTPYGERKSIHSMSSLKGVSEKVSFRNYALICDNLTRVRFCHCHPCSLSLPCGYNQS